MTLYLRTFGSEVAAPPPARDTDRPDDIEVLAVRLGDAKTPVGFLVLYRGATRNGFSLAERSALVKLAPEVGRALAGKNSPPDLVVPSPEQGFFLVDTHGVVQTSCARAQKLLSMISPPHALSTTEAAELPDDLKRKIADILDRGKPVEASWRFRASWGVFLFHARLLRASSDPESRSIAVTVTLEEPQSLHVFRKCRELRLTARQTEILLALVREESYEQIAEQLTISVHTVVDHLRKLYRQLGVSNRGALVMRILA